MNSKRQSSIHKVRELHLDTIDIEREYDVIKEIGEGDYGKVVLAVHKETASEVKFITIKKLILK